MPNGDLVVRVEDEAVLRGEVPGNAELGPGIVLHLVVVSVEMVGGYVRDNRDVRSEVITVVQLETADFQDVIIELLSCHLQGVALAYVAAEADVQARLLEQVVDERGGSGLAVASGDADLLRAVVPCRELDFGDDVYAFLLRFPDHGRGARDARTLDDFVGIEYQLLAVLSLFVGYLPLLEHADVAVGYLPLVGEEHVESLDLCQDSGANSAFRST